MSTNRRPFRRPSPIPTVTVSGTAWLILLLAPLAAARAQSSGAPPPQITLPDGSVWPLMPPEVARVPGRSPLRLSPPRLDLPSSLVVLPIALLPPSVDLTAQQTPVRSQGGRDTCSSFGVTAAVEAAYVRLHGLRLDLSEQYMQHVQKSFWLNWTQPLPYAEIQPETNGGGNVPWNFAVLGRYGLPTEASLPYIGAGDYQDTTQPGDNPFNLSNPMITQRALDDFNLSGEPRDYYIPGYLRTTVFPQAALDEARYAPTQVEMAPSPGDLDWYRSQLALGREVAFGFLCCGTYPSSPAAVWQPGATGGAHVMLMVGYDDSRRAFRVKNSWNDFGGQFLWFSYDFVTGGLVYEAGAIVAVADPYAPFDVFHNKQLILGRWNLDFDGWLGVLDIYRLPHMPGDGSKDKRIGTYFAASGAAYRVNGTITGNQLDFYIDWNTPNQPYDVLQGVRFTAFPFEWDHSGMAGTMRDASGNIWAFQASKKPLLQGSSAGPLGPDSFNGRWATSIDGRGSTLELERPLGQPATLQGRFAHAGGWLPVTGTIGPDPRWVTFTIPFPGGTQSFSGYLNGHELGVMSGTTTWNGLPFGFWAYRQGALEPRPPLVVRPPRGPLPLCTLLPNLPNCR